MLFDPFEEQLDLPLTPVQLGGRQDWQREIVAQENQGFIGLRILESNAAQARFEVLECVEAGKQDGLVADHRKRKASNSK